jgi:hypothetical protein
VTVLPLTDPVRFPDGPGTAAAASRRCADKLMPPQPVADAKTPALPAVRQLHVVVVPENELLAPEDEPGTLAAGGGVLGVFGVVPPQLDSNSPSATITIRPAHKASKRVGNFMMISSGERLKHPSRTGYRIGRAKRIAF